LQVKSEMLGQVEDARRRASEAEALADQEHQVIALHTPINGRVSLRAQFGRAPPDEERQVMGLATRLESLLPSVLATDFRLILSF